MYNIINILLGGVLDGTADKCKYSHGQRGKRKSGWNVSFCIYAAQQIGITVN
jgi:hypothetical protein